MSDYSFQSAHLGEDTKSCQKDQLSCPIDAPLHWEHGGEAACIAHAYLSSSKNWAYGPLQALAKTNACVSNLMRKIKE